MSGFELWIHFRVHQVAVAAFAAAEGYGKKVVEVCWERLERRFVAHEAVNVHQEQRSFAAEEAILRRQNRRLRRAPRVVEQRCRRCGHCRIGIWMEM